MSSQVFRGIGVGCLVLCVSLLFAACERYQDKINRTTVYVTYVKMPPATKYAFFFATLSAIGAVVCFRTAWNGKSHSTTVGTAQIDTKSAGG